jgi:hypothetical protein
MGYIGSGVQRFNTADGLTVTGSAEINSLTYPTADGSNGQVLKTNGSGTLSFGTVSTDLVNDTSPQLGGDLQSNGNDIVFADNDKAIFGAGSDLQITHTGSHSQIVDSGTGGLFIGGSSQIGLMNAALNEYMVNAVENGAVTLYHDNSAKIYTQSHGARIDGGLRFASSGAASDTSNPYIFRTSGADNMAFATGSAERMRLDSSGNLLVGGTSLGENGAVTMGGDGRIYAIRASDTAGFFGRTSSDGSIVNFTKDGTTVGSIGTVAGDMVAGTGDTGLRFHDGADQVYPSNTNGSGRDAAIDLGNNGARFKDGYFNGTLYAGRFAGKSDNNTYIDFQGSDVMQFITGGSQRAMFDDSANFLVGASSLNDTNGFTVFPTGSGSATMVRIDRSSNGTALQFRQGQSAIGTVSTTTSGVTYNTTSDRRLKQDIEPLEATDKLMAMNPVSYSWKANPDGPRSMGFIAQEMQEVMPEAVSTGDDDDAMMSMDYGRITPILVSALQDAHRKIEQLEQRLAEMETGNE